MDKFEYRPATVGIAPIKMDGPLSFIGTGEELRSREWEYELLKTNIVTAARMAREVGAKFYADFATMNELTKAADADIINKTPGTFIAQGEWKQRGYVVSSEPSDIHFGRLTTRLKMLLLDGTWWKLADGVSLMPDEIGSDGLDYPHDYPHDYTKPTSNKHVNTGSIIPCKPRIVFYGAVTNPHITIAGNLYQVNGSLDSSSRIEIDARQKTVKKIAQDGTVTDMFADALRGSGENGGEYVFQSIPAGELEVTWDGSFGVDVQWYLEAGEPPWSLY